MSKSNKCHDLVIWECTGMYRRFRMIDMQHDVIVFADFFSSLTRVYYLFNLYHVLILICTSTWSLVSIL